MPGLSIHMDFFGRSLGPLCTHNCGFLSIFLPSASFQPAGSKGTDRATPNPSLGRTKSYATGFALFLHFNRFSAYVSKMIIFATRN